MLKITITTCLKSVIFFINELIRILFSVDSLRSSYFFQKTGKQNKFYSDFCYEFIYSGIFNFLILYFIAFAFGLLTKKINFFALILVTQHDEFCHTKKKSKSQNKVLNYLKISINFFLLKLNMNSLFSKQYKKLILNSRKLWQTKIDHQNKKQRFHLFRFPNFNNSQFHLSVLNLAFPGYCTESSTDYLNQTFAFPQGSRPHLHPHPKGLRTLGLWLSRREEVQPGQLVALTIKVSATGRGEEIINPAKVEESKNQNSIMKNNFFFGFGNKTNNDSRQFSENSSLNVNSPIKKKAFVTSLETSVNGTLKTQSKEANDKFVSITYEEIGLFPRSFNRVFDRFFKQIFSDVENLVLQEYRFYRYLFLTTIKTIFILFFVPLIINLFTKNYIVRPLTEYFWNTKQPEIFLNSYQQKRAFSEFQEFEEQLFFESLISLAGEQPAMGVERVKDNSTLLSGTQTRIFNEKTDNSFSSSSLFNFDFEKSVATSPSLNRANESPDVPRSQFKSTSLNDQIQEPSEWEFGISNSVINGVEKPLALPIAKTDLILLNSDGRAVGGGTLPTTAISSESRAIANDTADTILLQTQNKLQQKTLELALRYNNYSIEAITNFFADLFSFFTLLYLFVSLEIQINITKSFLLEVFFGLDDSKKSLLILLVTDLLVGYHSPNIWELFFEFIFNHYGIPESQTVIFLLVATLPVLLDVLFKYLIFRHLNRSSPTTVATYHAMIE
uniref:Potassium/proton antiporter CemA n=1 Tax=Lobochlamys segnis TaxID=52035 RepID=A0A0S2IBW5_9CHLO|nr:chloroplast enveloppe membrane protein [Lobochlamys segnis]